MCEYNSNFRSRINGENEKIIQELISEFSKIGRLNKFIQCIILTGSRSKGDFNIYSDADIIIIGNWATKNFLDRIDELRSYINKLNIHIPIDYFCYTPKEIESLIENANPLILDAIDSGICIYNEQFFKKLKSNLNEKIEKKLIIRTPTFWKSNID